MNSLDCSDQVCDPSTQYCVDCVGPADCDAGQTCVGSHCHTICDSDKDCTSQRLLCDVTDGYCVQCNATSDCSAFEYCRQGSCIPAVCAPNTATCADNGVASCNADGSALLTPVACDGSQVCARSGTSASCQDLVCTPSVSGCSATGEKVVLCSGDGMSQQVTEDCGADGNVCVAASCQPVVCAAGSAFCSGSELRRCSVKGDASTLVQTCSASQFCDATTGQCRNQICAPGAPTCNGDVATTCNAVGSGYGTGGTDCATSSLHCVLGECTEHVCAPNGLFCQNGAVYQCAADGLSSSLSQSCGSDQYCDAASASCVSQVCSPNQPACNANVASTCNSDGSGYVSAGTDCGSLHCFGGVCQSALFVEDFEDGDFAGWTTAGTFTRTVASSIGANGTAHSLMLYSTQNDVSGWPSSALYHTFDSLQPTHISWWVLPTSNSATVLSGSFVLSSNGPVSDTSYWIASFEFQGTSINNKYVFTPYFADQWCHLEMRNIDWNARKYDWYVNDALVGSGQPFFGQQATDVRRLDLGDFSATTAYFDEIVFD